MTTTSARPAASAHDGAVRWIARARAYTSAPAGERVLPGLVAEWRRAIPALIAASLIAPSVGALDGFSQLQIPSLEAARSSVSQTNLIQAAIADGTIDLTAFSADGIDTVPAFEPNAGQFDADIDHLLRQGNTSVAIGDGAVTIGLLTGAAASPGTAADGGRSTASAIETESTVDQQGFAATLTFVGADPDVVSSPSAVDGPPTNYFLGDDPANWVTGLQAAGAVEYTNLVGTTDIRFLAVEDGFRFDAQVEPGTDPESLAIDVTGASLSIGDDGDLNLVLGPDVQLTYSAPIAFQEIDGERVNVDAAFVLADDDTFGFAVGEYDESVPLVIDPTLDLSTFIGGSLDEYLDDAALDGSGNIVVVGGSNSSNYPTAGGAYDTSSNGSGDIVVTKLAEDGATVLWSTYIGGSGFDEARAVEVASDGSVYISGYSNSSNFPTTGGAYDTSHGGGNDAVVSKLSSDGTSLDASTYLGGSSDDYSPRMVLDGNGDVVVGVDTTSTDFPTTGGAYDTVKDGGTTVNDPAIAKLNSSLTTLTWATMLGGGGDDYIQGLDTDATNQVYAIIETTATGLTTSAGAYDSTHNGGTNDMWVGRLNSTGTTLGYGTYLGGTGNDAGSAALTAHAADRIYITSSATAGFPTTGNAAYPSANSTQDTAFVVLDPTQTGAAQLFHGTFLGGTNDGYGEGVAVDSLDRAFIVGDVAASLLATGDAVDSTLGGSYDAMFSIIDPADGSLDYFTYLGGSSSDVARAVLIDAAGDAIVVGNTASSDFTTTAGAYNTTFSGGSDGFVVRYDLAEPVLDPVVLDDVQKGTATISDGTSSTTATIAAVDPTRAFLTYTVRGNNSSPNDIAVTGVLTNSTTATFSRSGTTGNMTIEWSVVEFTTGVTVQRGTLTALGNATLSSVDLSRSFALVNSRAPGTTFGDNDFVTAQLTSPTNLSLSANDTNHDLISWQVVTYNDAVVQRGTTSFTTVDATQTATLTTVDTSKSWLVYSTASDSGTVNNIGQKLMRGSVTNPTTLTFDRSNTGQAMSVSWELVEFTDTATVQHASAAFTTAQTNQDVTITAVDPARSIAVGGASLIGGRSSYAADDNPGVGWFTTRLTTSTNLNIQRDVTGSSPADLGWFVLTWPAAVIPACLADSDGDGLWDCEEDANTDLDGDPATSPGPNTDGDAFPNYLDADDDGDGIPTASENADPNADGDPRDAPDSDRDGQPDYLDLPTDPALGIVNTEQKISSTAGGLVGPLDDNDRIGLSVGPVGDVDGDGIVDVAVGTFLDDDGGSNRGAVYVLFLNTDGTVKAEQKISSTTGGLVGPLDDADQFGSSVTSVGDLDGDGIPDVAVGAYEDDDGGTDRGAVYVLLLNADGTVKAEQKISATTGGLVGPLGDFGGFGWSLSGVGDVDGDGNPDVAVGAIYDDDGGTDRGAVYVLFLNADGTVKAEQKISSTTGGLVGPVDDSDYFGHSVSGLGDLDGDGIADVVVGAYSDDDGGTDRGAVYVLFLNADGTVKAEQKISSTTGGLVGPVDDVDSFGGSVSGLGDLDGDGIADVVVGAYSDDDGGTDRGAVYVLFLNADGTVKAEQKISSTTGGLSGPLDDIDNFGWSMSGVGDLDGDGAINLVVGATGDDDGGTGRGAVYILNLTALVDSDGDGLWDNQEDANTDLDGDPATSPGPDTDSDTLPNYLDADDDGDAILTASENADPNADGDPRDALDVDRDGQPDYLDAPTGASDGTVMAEQKISSTTGGLVGPLDDVDYFGMAVTSIGDVDGDGIVDVAVGARRDDDGGTDRGAAYVLFLNADGTVKAEQKISSTTGGLVGPLDDSDYFGESVSGVGDLDGDGIPDVAVGVERDDDGGTDRGAAYVLFLNADGTVKAEQKISSTTGGLVGPLDDIDWFGGSVSGVGDIDGDGIVDVAVGARRDDDGGTDRGAAYVLFLNADGTVKAEQKISSTTGGLAGPLDDSDWFGQSFSGVGDIDGDGTPDVAVGVNGDDDGGSTRGAVYVLFLNADGTVKAEQKISSTTGGLTGPLDDGDRFGRSVSGVGDIDGDGTPDIAAGAYWDDDDGAERGAVYLLFLNADGTAKAEQKISSTEGGLTGPLDNSDQFAVSVSGVGDLNSDGVPDVAVGAIGDDDGGSNRGAIYILNLAVGPCGTVDSDGDGLLDCEEDANTDLDGDPTTNPGPNTDGDGLVNYLDADDDGDGIATSAENADPNADGDPRDAIDTDRDGEPDYLDVPTAAADLALADEQKISSTQGGLTGPLDDNDYFGRAASSIGDVDGDGIVDLAAAATFDDDGFGSAGAVYVLFLNADGTVRAEQKISATSGGLTGPLGNSDWFGSSVSGVGDVDGDGVADLVVGASRDDDGGTDRGAVYVLFLNSDGTVKAEQKVSSTVGGLSASLGDSELFGRSASGIGDLDGDGINDLVVGTHLDADGGTGRGAVHVLFLNADGTVKAEQKISSTVGGLSGPLEDSDGFGWSASGVGDLDGDGTNDLAVGAITDDDGGSNRGAVYVLFLNTDGTVRAEQKISDSVGGLSAALVNTDQFGSSVAGIGDVDADGVGDLVVGAINDDDGGPNRGAAYVLLMNSDGTVKDELEIGSTQGGLAGPIDDSDSIGFASFGLGDLDGDGFINFGITSPTDDDGGSNRGAVYILDLTSPLCTVDSDGDGLWDCEEDANTDADNNPATSPGPNTDGDGLVNYLDADDDGDGTPTASENADPNADGDPRDALDSDRDGQPDFLDVPTGASDGTVNSEQKISATVGGLVGPLGDDDNFGTSVTSVGDLDGDGIVDVVVGAYRDDDGGFNRGAIYVLFLNADGTVKGEQKISSTTGGLTGPLDDADQFGSSVTSVGDLDGDGIPDVAVGAYEDDDDGTDRGAVYVLLLNADGTVKGEQKISSTAGGLTGPLDDSDYFGRSVTSVGDLDGDGITDIAVSAYYDDDGGTDRGAVYVLLLNADGTVKGEQKISSTTGGLTGPLDNSDRFGVSVSGVGDLDGDGIADIAVGAYEDDDGGTDRGAVYVLFLNADGTVKAEQKISSTTGGLIGPLDDNDWFSNSVSGVGDLDGDDIPDLAIGAYLDDDGGNDRGAVYVLFLNADGTVKAEHKISSVAGGLVGPLVDNDRFGTSVSGVGDLDGDGVIDVAVGAGSDDDGGGNRGAIYILNLRPPPVDSDGDGLWDREEDANTDLDGNPATSPGPNTDGDAFPNYLDADDDGDGTPTASENADPNADGDPRDARDTDRDGVPDYLDLAAGASRTPIVDEQKISDTEGGLVDNLDDSDYFGEAVASIGDIDGDGVNDIAVGTIFDDDGGANRGAIRVLFLNSNGTVKAEQKISDLDGGLTATLDDSDFFGRSIAGIGDIDGDGVNDMAVGATGDDDGGSSRGAVHVLFLNADGTVKAEQKISVLDGGLTATLDESENFGRSIAGIGDVDGDGFNDIAVGAPNDDDGGTNRGAVHVLFLNADGTVKAEQKISDTQGSFAAALVDNDSFGLSLAGIGDVDADGVEDLVAGAPGDDDGEASSGAVYVLFLNTDGTVKAEQKISDTVGGLAAPLDSFDSFGDAVTGIGDVNGDGIGDIAVGVPDDDDGGLSRGAIYVLALSASGSVVSENKISSTTGGLTGPLDDSDTFGTAVAGLGDLDGDGTLNLLVGAPFDDDGGGINRGAVYVLDLSPYTDSDGDGLWDHEEDANTDLDENPATSPGPNTDGDANPNYLDADDDGDTVLTSAENADPNGDGDPRDARDADWDGQPDYLDVPTAQTSGVADDEQRISATDGGLAGPVETADAFGQSVATIGDLDGDGIVDVIVGADGDDDVNSSSGAVYVLFLNADGTVKAEQKISNLAGGLSATLQFDDRFGSGVAGLGDVDGDGLPDAAVGAFGTDDAGSNTGAIYVLLLNADGTVKAEQKISNLAGDLSVTLDGADRFGSTVGSIGDLDGDGIPDVAVGAVWDDDGASDSGAIYILFLNADGTVKNEQKVSNTTGGLSPVLAASDYFGSAVTGIGDIDGDGIVDVAVGAYTADDGASAAGAVHILLMNSDGTVKAQQELSNSEGGLAATLQLGDYFGYAIAGLGDLDIDGVPDIAVSAMGTDNGGTDRGTVYVLLLNADGSIKSEQQISGLVGGLTTAPADGDQFGAALTGLGDIDGDGTIGLAIGARYADDGASNSGAIYVLDLVPHPCSVDSDGDGLWDCEEDANNDLDGNPATNPGPNTDGDAFPNYLDADDDGDALLTSAENADPNADGDPRDALDSDRDGEPDYLDLPTGRTIGFISDEQKLSDTTGGLVGSLDDADHFGRAVAPIGDLDGDGVVDIAVGALRDSDGGINRGAVYILFLNADGTIKTEQKLSDTTGGLTEPLDDTDNFGTSVTSIGDLDGDGTPDIAVGAPGDDDGGINRGAVYILTLNTNGTIKTEQKLSDTTGGLTEPLDDYDSFGTSVTSIGDLDNDGTPDIAVGANRDDDGGINRGAVYILTLNTNGTIKTEQKLSDTTGGLTEPLGNSDYLGTSVSGIGDLDNDGTPDIVVGAYGDDDGGTNRGAIYILTLNTSGTIKTEQKLSDTTGELTATLDDFDSFGYSASGLGDLDSDGTINLAVGSFGDGDGGYQRGAVYVFDLQAAPLTVNSTDDDVDSNIGDGFCDTGQLNADGDPECTLRAAIEEADQWTGIDTIEFDIPVGDTGHAAGIWTIEPVTALPEITALVTIDGTTQPGYTASPVIAVSGNVAPVATDGLRVGALADGTTITGLAVINFSDDGIELNSSADNTQLIFNFVGVHPDGSAAGNGDEGIDANDADSVLIDSNVIVANGGFGIQTGGTNVLITANLIGLAPDGLSPMGNTAGGIEVSVGAVAGVIGGRGPGEGNAIAHNGGDGITVLAPTQAPVMVGNVIRDNGGLGIDIDADGVTTPDPGDVDVSRLNQPVLLAASESGGITTVDLAFDTMAGDYVIDYYANPSGADPSGYGEGEQLIATVPVTHNGFGSTVLRHAVPGTGLTITATATSVATPETSEFSNAITGSAIATTIVRDSSVRRSNTYATGGAPSSVTGVAGNAIDFSGTDLLTGPGLDITSSNLALGAWVRLDALTGDDAIISKRATSGFPIYELAVDGTTGEAVATVRVGGAPVTVRGGTINLATWHQVDAQWTGTELILYVDGVEVDRVAAVGALATDVTTEVSIGGRSDNTRTVEGIIDHISINHAAPDADRIATHNTNVTSAGFITVGNEQTSAPGAWTASTTQSRTGTYSLSAPEIDPGESPAWAVARNIDEPGLVFESYWWLSQATQLDLAAGTRAGDSLADQYSAAATDTPFRWELRQPAGDTTSVDGSATDTAATGSWVKVEMWTDQLGDTRLLVDGVEIIGWTSQGGALASGSAGLLATLLPTGTEWYVDDARARKLVTPEPTTTLGPIVRN